MVKEALAVERGILFAERPFEGFIPLEERDFLPIILNNHSYHERGDELESNESLKQIIPYVCILNPKERKVFMYRRAGEGNYTEQRLWNRYSLGVGGHIERTDSRNPITNAMMREVMEEVRIQQYPEPKIVGFINDESGSVERVHFGVFAIMETTDSVEKGDDEMTEGRFYSIGEVEALLADSNNKFDRWTEIAWPIVRDYLNSLD